MNMRLLLASLCALACLSSLASAQSLRRAPGYADPYPVENLARVMGEMHYLSFACEGRNAQSWRDAMVELLDHEAPTRGSYRQRLIDRFNEGFLLQERRRTRCGAEAEFARQTLAEEGQILSDQLRRTYLQQ